MLKKEKVLVFYLFNVDCGDFFSEFSALEFLRSVCVCVCLSQLSDQSSLTEKLSLSSVVQSAVKMHSMVSHISPPRFCLSAWLPPTACVTMATWQPVTVWCVFPRRWSDVFWIQASGKTLDRPFYWHHLFGASSVSGSVPARPTLNALKLFK